MNDNASQSQPVTASQKSTDEESYASYFQDYGTFYSCTLCYNMQTGLSGRPNMVSTLEERSIPVPLKDGGSITNFKRHLQSHQPMFLTQKDLENLIGNNLEHVMQIRYQREYEKQQHLGIIWFL